MLQPTKLKPAQEVIKEKKQQNIKNFFQKTKYTTTNCREATSPSTKPSSEITTNSTASTEAERTSPPPPQEELSRSLNSTKTTITSTVPNAVVRITPPPPKVSRSLPSTKITSSSTNLTTKRAVTTNTAMKTTTRNKTTTKKIKQQQEQIRNKEKNKGYWTQLAARKKEQEQAKLKGNNENIELNLQGDQKSDNTVIIAENVEHRNSLQVYSFEASPKQEILLDDVTGSFLELSTAKPDNPGRIKIIEK